MAFVKADRVQEISRSTGTGDMALLGAWDASYRTFASQMSNGDTCQILIINQNAMEWEIDEATYVSSTNSIQRTTFVDSSTGSAITFSSGNKRVAMLPIASTMVVENNSGDASITRDLTVNRNLIVVGTSTLPGFATKTGTLVAGNVPILTTTGIQDSGVALVSTMSATTVWSNNTASSAAPLANTKLTLGNGTAAAPIYSFNASSGTGMYSPQANYLGFSAGGYRILQLRSADATSYFEMLFSGRGICRVQGATNLDASFSSAGTGDVFLENSNTNSIMFRVGSSGAAGSANNYLRLVTGQTGANPTFSPIAQSSGDTNIGIDFTPVGTGLVRNTATGFHALSAVATAAGSATQFMVKGGTSGVGVYYGTGNPSFTAAKGSLYTKTDASTTTTRLWVNTDGATTWTNFTSAA